MSPRAGLAALVACLRVARTGVAAFLPIRPSRDRALRLLVAAFIGAAAAVATAATFAGAKTDSEAAAGKTNWLTISGFWDGVTGPELVDSASGRGWMGFISGQSRSTLGSLRRVGGKLSFAKTTLAAQGPMFVVGSQLVYHLPDVSGTPGELRTAPLLANGEARTPRAVPDDPEKLPPEELGATVGDGIEVGDRIVWLLGGAKLNDSGNVVRTYLWACCTGSGELSDLTRFIEQGRPTIFEQLAVDSRKRLWVAWLQRSRSAVVGSVKLLQLDPETLAPRTPRAVTLPGGSAATGLKLSCAAFCRAVFTDLFSGDLLASSPGQRSPDRMASGTRENGANLLAATNRSGRLTAAYIASRSPDPAKAQLHEIEVVSGDPTGSHPRRLAAVDLPDAVGPSADLYQNAYGTFVPGGLVYFAFYYPGGTKTHILAGFLPVAH